jgi:hypothetical protein
MDTYNPVMTVQHALVPFYSGESQETCMNIAHLCPQKTAIPKGDTVVSPLSRKDDTSVSPFILLKGNQQ